MASRTQASDNSGCASEKRKIASGQAVSPNCCTKSEPFAAAETHRALRRFHPLAEFAESRLVEAGGADDRGRVRHPGSISRWQKNTSSFETNRRSDSTGPFRTDELGNVMKSMRAASQKRSSQVNNGVALRAIPLRQDSTSIDAGLVLTKSCDERVFRAQRHNAANQEHVARVSFSIAFRGGRSNRPRRRRRTQILRLHLRRPRSSREVIARTGTSAASNPNRERALFRQSMIVIPIDLRGLTAPACSRIPGGWTLIIERAIEARGIRIPR